MGSLAQTAKLLASLDFDTSKWKAGVGSATNDLGKLEGRFAKLGGHVRRGLGNAATNLASIGVVAGGFALAGLTASVREASSLNEEVSKSQVVFGKASEKVLEFSKTTASSMGLARSESLGAAAAFGNMFNTIGLSEDASADMSVRLVQLAADMASFNNEDPTEMLLRLRSGLSGEAEPLRRFGVLISAARVQEEAYAAGIAKRGEALTEQQKVQARYNLLLKDTTIQQGDFERTSESLANQQRILKASLRDTGATIGTALLPQLSKVAIRLNDVIKARQPDFEALAKELPGIFDSAIKFAENIPWDAIEQTFRLMGMGAKTALDLFTSMPPWVQTAVLTGWGLNKLTGGALGSIVGELGKGLIKGVLGMNAGVVNINAGVVNGAGGIGGGVAGAGGRGLLGKLAFGLGTAASGIFLAELLKSAHEAFVMPGLQQQAQQNISNTEGLIARGDADLLRAEIRRLRDLPNKLNPLERALYDLNAQGVKVHTEGLITELERALEPLADERRAGANAQLGANFRINANAGWKPVESAVSGVKAAVTGGLAVVAQEQRSVGSIIAGNAAQERTQMAFAAAAQAAQAASQVLATTGAGVRTASATDRVAAATRNVPPPITSAIYSIGRSITSTIWQARPIIQPTTIIQKTTVTNRTGERSDSRTVNGR